MLPRIYLPAAAADSRLSLDNAQSKHLIKVLRMRRHGELVVFDGAGNAYGAVIAEDNKNSIIIETGAALPPSPADGGRKIHIGQSVCASAKMDWAIEKMTELGAASITPLLTKGNKRPPAPQQQQRWRQLTIAACKQCGRNVLPALLPAATLADWQPAGNCIILTPRAEQPLSAVKETLAAATPLTFAVGGESGFSADEEAQLIACGFQAAHLGARILRAETAALAALALFL